MIIPSANMDPPPETKEANLKEEDVESSNSQDETRGLRLDKHGLPLIPQPTTNANDPLNWPQWLKNHILLQVAIMALLGLYNSACVNPAYVELAKQFEITTIQASYQTAVAIATGGVGALIWIPLANVYGRRPVYLFTTLITTLSAFGSGRSNSFAALIVARVFNGLASSAGLALGAGVVADLFFLHERGRAMGIFTVFLTNGAHLSPLPGGFIAQTIGWRWCFYVAGILNVTMLFVMLATLPETLYYRDVTPHLAKSMRSRFRLWGFKYPNHDFAWVDVVRPFQMALYPSAIIPAVYYAVQYAYGSIEPAVTVATTFSTIYHFDSGRIGLALGLSLLLGSSLGEFASGPIIDHIMSRSRRKTGGAPVPEVRLQAIWTGAFLVPAGLLIYGFCIHFRTHFVAPCIGMALSSFGLQVIAGVTYTYCADCYKPQTSEISSLFSIVRQTFGFTLAFYSIPFANKVGYQWSFTTFAAIGVVFFLPVIWLMIHGKAVRERLGQPQFNNGL